MSILSIAATREGSTFFSGEARRGEVRGAR